MFQADRISLGGRPGSFRGAATGSEVGACRNPRGVRSRPSEGAGKQVSFLDTGQSLHGCIDEIPSDRTEEAIANDVARANSCGDVDPVLAISGVSTGIESDDAKEDGSCGVDRRMCSAGDRLLG